MAKRDNRAKLYAFLDGTGVLATGDASQIKAAKRKYWANYKREWKKKKRGQHKSFTIYFLPKDCKSIQKAAASYGMSATKFIAHTALEAAGKSQVFDPALAGQIRQVIVLSCVYVQGVLEGDIKVANKTDAILNRLEQLEAQVLALIIQK